MLDSNLSVKKLYQEAIKTMDRQRLRPDFDEILKAAKRIVNGTGNWRKATLNFGE